MSNYKNGRFEKYQNWRFSTYKTRENDGIHLI